MYLQTPPSKMIRKCLYKNQYIKSSSNQGMELFKKIPVKSLKEMLDAIVTTPIILYTSFFCVDSSYYKSFIQTIFLICGLVQVLKGMLFIICDGQMLINNMSQELSTLQEHVDIELRAYQVNINALESRLKRLKFYSSLFSIAREHSCIINEGAHQY